MPTVYRGVTRPDGSRAIECRGPAMTGRDWFRLWIEARRWFDRRRKFRPLVFWPRGKP